MKIKKIIFYIVLCFSLFGFMLSACSNVSTIQQDRHFKITGNDIKGFYDYYIFDNFGNVVYTGHTEGKEPDISYTSREILEIRLHGGTYADICKYYNTLTNKFSEEYENPFLVEDGLIVYYNADSKKLIARDLFDEKVFYKDFSREISIVLAPEYVEFKDNNSRLEIRYFKNADDIISETLNLK